jgi:hypothetical protein
MNANTLEKLWVYTSLTIIIVGIFLIIEQQKELKPVYDCLHALGKSHEGTYRFKSQTHAFNWCDAHRDDWKSKVTPRTIKAYEKMMKQRAEQENK